ncbi:hypothetical protein LRR80_05499 [Streptomyces sp. RO-S4]|nr:hypothetical protein [Streptomyces sp. RO-S4]
MHGHEVARPDEDFGRDVGLAEHLAHVTGDVGERVVLAGRVAEDQLPCPLVLLGVQDGEDQVLQLRLERLDTEPFGERDEHVTCHLGDAFLLGGAHHAEGAHVVQPVGELDRHHADVVAGGDEHLAEGLGLRGGPVVDLLQLGDAVDEVADLLAELLAHLLERDVGVLDGVVQQRGGQRRGLGAEFGQDEGDGERVGDVRLAALAHLSAVRGLGQHIGAAQRFEVGVGVVGSVRLDDVSDGVGQPVAGGRSQQRGAAQAAQVEPGTGLPARPGGCDVARRHRARGRGFRGLRVHEHLRLRGSGGRRPRADSGLGDGVAPPSGPVLDATEPHPVRPAAFGPA